jgi:hypothetical protein
MNNGNGDKPNGKLANLILSFLLPPLIGGVIAWCRATNVTMAEHGEAIAVIKEKLDSMDKKLDHALKGERR